ncbi:MAG: hypothetical protein ACYC6T_08155 [Thermoleophilia bacterium]
MTTADTFRDVVLAGMCPYCGKGAYKSIASHTFWAHGVTGAELREEAGLQRGAQLTSDDLHQRFSERSARHLAEDPEWKARLIAAGQEAIKNGGRASSWDRAASRESHLADRQSEERRAIFKKSMAQVDHKAAAAARTPEAREADTKRVLKAAERYRQEHPEWQSERSRQLGLSLPRSHFSEMGKLGVAARLKVRDKWLAAVKKSAAKRAKVPREEYPTIIARASAGETRTAIAGDYGVSRSLIYQIVTGRKK